MARSRKKHPRRRRVLIALVLIVVGFAAFIALTEPRQLPAIIADHPAARTLYAWRDSAFERVHGWVYPLASLRTEQANPEYGGTGYKQDDRKALEQLLESKEGAAP